MGLVLHMEAGQRREHVVRHEIREQPAGTDRRLGGTEGAQRCTVRLRQRSRGEGQGWGKGKGRRCGATAPKQGASEDRADIDVPRGVNECTA